MTKANYTIDGALPGNVPADCHPVIRRGVAYWLSLRPAEGLPGRQHLDPIDIPDLLADMCLLDIVGDPPRFMYRIAGTRICDFFGRELTGRWHDETPENVTDSRAERDLLSVMKTGEPTWRLERPLLSDSMVSVNVERVYLPLARNGTDVDMIMGVMVSHSASREQD